MSDMKWQPIETAPLDGTPVLVVDDDEGKGDGCVYIATYSSHYGWTLDTSPQVEGYPTHWMPLPELPEKNAKIERLRAALLKIRDLDWPADQAYIMRNIAKEALGDDL